MIILGIETSCDETAASILIDGKILSNVVHSQLIHKNYGGVVPDLASKNHEKNLLGEVGKKVKPNFEYSSNTNTKWMTSKNIKTWLNKYIKSEDYTKF